MLNMYDLGSTSSCPTCEGRRWARAVDTALPSPDDIARAGAEVPVDGATYLVSGRSVVVLDLRTA